MLTRRDFVKIMAAMGSLVLLPPLNMFKRLYAFDGATSLKQSATLSQTSQLGEFYAGFLLLSEGTPVPPFVKYPERGMPTFCGVSVTFVQLKDVQPKNRKNEYLIPTPDCIFARARAKMTSISANHPIESINLAWFICSKTSLTNRAWSFCHTLTFDVLRWLTYKGQLGA